MNKFLDKLLDILLGVTASATCYKCGEKGVKENMEQEVRGSCSETAVVKYRHHNCHTGI